MDGLWMKSLRTGVHLLEKEVAKELGVTSETVSRWERGTHSISKMAEDSFMMLINDAARVQKIIGERRSRRAAARGARFIAAGVSQ
jgi:DNA-binding transcriptional regulator YiaG